MDIRIDNLSFFYDDIRALSDINIRIKEGTFTAILGKNGSGKTTLAKNINGLYKPNSGFVFLGKEKTEELSVGDLAEKVGYLFQNPDDQIFSKTVYDEVSFGPLNLGYKKSRVDNLVEKSLKITGLEGLKNENPLELSSEKRRLLALASVIALDSKTIIMDEPACGLGSVGRKILMDVIKMLGKDGKTLIVITHDMDFVLENLSEAVLLKKGEVVFHGLTLDLFSDKNLCMNAGLEIPQIVKLCHALDLEPVKTKEEFVENLYIKRNRI